MSPILPSVVFIDANVSDLQHLINGVLPDIAVKVLEANANGIDQITEYLQAYPASTVHLISHGAPGSLFLGNGQLNLTNLDAYANALASWFSAATSESTLLLYGCNVAAGDAGAEFIEKLHRLTGAEIGASTQPIGNGTWHLNATCPAPSLPHSPATPFHPATIATYSGLLTLTQISNFILPTGSSSPYGLTNINGTLYFAANDGIHGKELWKSDGTEAGTVLVKDIVPGTGPYYGPYRDPVGPGLVANLNGTLYFISTDDALDGELWKSDGTEAGTVRVKDIRPGTGGSDLAFVTNINNTLYFRANDGIHGEELWKSDGTEAGTVLVKDIVPGSDGSGPDSLTNVNGTLYFRANDNIHGWELWKSDGTEAGTVLVKDIVPGSTSSSPHSLTSVNGTLYFFVVNDSMHGRRELWKSDGTEAGTVLVKDIPGSNSFDSNFLTSVNSTLYFVVDDGIHGKELWKSDGTEAGTILVKDIVPGTGSSYPRDLINTNGTLYFWANNDTNVPVLWKSDGTEAGTVLVSDAVTGPNSLVPLSNPLTNVNGTLYFQANDNIHGEELWKSDGTEAGTVRVKDILPGTGSSSPFFFTNVNGTLYFKASDPIHGTELWMSDGTEAGTVLVKDINQQEVQPPSRLTIVGSIGYFVSSDPIHGTELWRSDGTEAGTVRVKDIRPGPDSSYPESLTNVNGALYFIANDRFRTDINTSGYELWKSDGTEAGTVLVKDIVGSDAYLTNVNGTLFFTSYDGTHGREWWKSDGTEAGTVLVKDVDPGITYTYPLPGSFASINSTFYFTANNGIHGNELWKSDGTEAGTVRVKDIVPGPVSSDPYHLTNVNGTLYFIATDGAHGRELWRSDGTEAGTVQVVDIVPGTGSSYLYGLTNINGTLYFWSNNGTDGPELWKSDGTEAGTVLVKDILPDSSTYVGDLTNINGTLYFTANDGTHGKELWKSDGTGVTRLVKDIYPGSEGSDLQNLTNINGTLYFTASDGIHGTGLWKTDGTEAGTVQMTEAGIVQEARYISLTSSPSSPSVLDPSLAALGNTLLFFADDGVNGVELWKMRANNTPPTGSVVLVGTATQGQTLTAINDLTDIDGIPGPITYQWQADGVNIDSATGNTLLLTQAQVGKAITAIASYTDGFGTPEAVVSVPTGPVTDPNPPVPNPSDPTPPNPNPPTPTPPNPNPPDPNPPDPNPPTPTPTQIIPLENQLLSVVGGAPTRLAVTVTAQGAASVLDVAVVLVDDAEGRVDGLLPSAAGYAAAALGRATTLLSVLKAGDFAGQFGHRSLAIAPGQFLQFALVQGGTLDDLKRGGTGQLFFATGATNANGQSIVQYRALAQGYLADFTLPGTASPSVTIQLGLDPTPAPVGSQQQGLAPQSEMLDLTGLSTPTVSLTLEVFREASFNNVMGFYTVEDSHGRVRDSLTGNLINPGEAGYLQAALANRVVGNLAGQNGQTLAYTATVATGQLISSFLVVNSSLDALLDSSPGNDSTVFFNHIAANSDGQDHVRLLGDNVFGYEDITGGGDRDFNDVIVKVSVA